MMSLMSVSDRLALQIILRRKVSIMTMIIMKGTLMEVMVQEEDTMVDSKLEVAG
ncbi:hypothetical protein KI387_034011, partial [Taxus chinensis]